MCLASGFIACSKRNDSRRDARRTIDAEQIERIKAKRDKIAQSSRERIEKAGGIKSVRGKACIVLDGQKICQLDYDKLRSLPQVEFEGKKEDVAAATLLDVLRSAGVETGSTVVFSNFVEDNLLSVPWQDIETRKDAFVIVVTPMNASRLRYKEASNDQMRMKIVRVKKIEVTTK